MAFVDTGMHFGGGEPTAGVTSFSLDVNMDEVVRCDIKCMPSVTFVERMNRGCTIWAGELPDAQERVIYQDVPVHPFLWQFAAMGSWMLLIVGALLKVLV